MLTGLSLTDNFDLYKPEPKRQLGHSASMTTKQLPFVQAVSQYAVLHASQNLCVLPQLVCLAHSQTQHFKPQIAK